MFPGAPDGPGPDATRAEPEGANADPEEVERFRAVRIRLLQRIASACSRTGRPAASVTLVAVTKTVPAQRIRGAIQAGFTILGENRVQEAAPKIADLARERASWHLIGPLQSNKAARAVELFDVVETVDSIALAGRLDRLAARRGRPEVPVLLEVNVDADPGKSGYDVERVEADLAELADLPRLRLLGLMTVGRLVTDPEDARPTFRRLRELSERLRDREPRLGSALSMGMSDDFEVAVEEGATIVRLGRVIFGERPAP